MEKSFDLKFDDYRPLLDKLQIPYKIDEISLIVGRPVLENQWVLFLSSRTSMATSFLERVVPYLWAKNVSFKIIKNQLLINKINGWGMSAHEVGKTVTIYTNSTEQAVELARELSDFTRGHSGPVVPGALRLGDVLYCSYSQLVVQAVNDKNQQIHGIKFIVPDKKIPFVNYKKYMESKKKRLIGNFYVPIEILIDSPKGIIYKAINIRNLTWCLIKQGNANAADDFQNRDIKHRLQWQNLVLEDLRDTGITPRNVKYFEQGEYSFLVMQYLEGNSVNKFINEIYAEKLPWKALPIATKSSILEKYLQAVKTICIIHDRGYVHRDITANNFIIDKSDKVYLIDFELSYSLRKKHPDPPFLMGTPGYVAPEQIKLAVSTIMEDIYSLGALLIFMITGQQPYDFILSERSELDKKLNDMVNFRRLTQIAIACIEKEASKRPTLDKIIREVETVKLGIIAGHQQWDVISCNALSI